jgi:hypothetical protein
MRWNLLLSGLFGLGAIAVWVVTGAPLDDPVWWYTAASPPRVVIDGPSGPLRGQAEVRLELEPAARTRVVWATVDGQPQPLRAGDERVVLDTRQLADGPHTLEVLVRDTSRQENRNTARWTFVTANGQ